MTHVASSAAAAGFVLLVLAAPASLSAQTITTALAPDTITVGQPIRVAVRLVLPDARPLFPDTLPTGPDVENLARVTVTQPDSTAPDAYTAAYTITGWRPGPLELDTLRVPLRAADGAARSVLVDLPDALVVSVLPPDTAGIEPKPARGVVGPSRVWWIWALGILAALAVIAALVWWWLRRRARLAAVSGPDVAPRERALVALDDAWQARPESGLAPDPFYEKVSRIVRAYLAELDPRWGMDRTTSEISAALLAHLTAPEVARLRALLKEADDVKFARAWPETETAERFWRAAREWVEQFREPLDEQEQQAEAAATEPHGP